MKFLIIVAAALSATITTAATLKTKSTAAYPSSRAAYPSFNNWYSSTSSGGEYVGPNWYRSTYSGGEYNGK